MQLNYFLTGCSGVFYKILDGSFLVKAVKTILCDDLWFERKILNSLAAGYDITQSSGNINSKTIDVKIEALTPREKCIVCYAIQGLPAKRIAQKLSVQEKTIRNQLTSIYQKLDVSGQVELCLKASELSSVMAFKQNA